MKKIILCAAALALAGCTTDGIGTKQTIGGLAGAVGGGVIGSKIGGGSGRTAAIIGGTVLGGLLGSEIGKSLDAADRAALNNAQSQAYAAPVGQQISWNNPQSGNSGYITPTRDGRDQQGRNCREFEQTIYVGGKAETGKGTACQNYDGSWQIVN